MRHIPPGPPVLETTCSASSTLRNYYSEKIHLPGFRSISRVFCQLIWKFQDLQVTKVGRSNVDSYETSSVETLATWPGVERNG